MVLSGVAAFTVRGFSDGVWQETATRAIPEMMQIELALETEERASKTVFIPASIRVRSTLERR